MKKLFKTVLFLLIPACLLFLVAGCNFNMEMSPVEGPVAKDNPASINVKGNAENNGQLELVMPDGEVCKGTSKTIKIGSASTNPSNFDSISIFGYSTWQKYWGDKFVNLAKNSHSNLASATLTGDRGTVLTAEFIYFKPPFSGLIKDNKGNLYKAQTK